MDWLLLLFTTVAGYFIGSIPFGYLVARAAALTFSSRAAATSARPMSAGCWAGRSASWSSSSTSPRERCRWSSARNLESPWPAGWLEVLAGLAAFLGHLFPLWLGFHGGKGVATGTGVVTVLVPGPALAAFSVWLLAVLATRYVSVASILAVLALDTTQLVAVPHVSDPRTLFCLFAGALVLVKHRSNLARLSPAPKTNFGRSLP